MSDSGSAVCPYLTMTIDELEKKYCKDTLSTQWVLAEVNAFLNEVINKTPLRPLRMDKEAQQKLFLSDLVVSLTKNRLLIREYIKARDKQLYDTLTSGDLSKSAIAGIGTALGIETSLAGDMFKVPLLSYIKATTDVKNPPLLPVNQIIIEGTVRLPLEQYANIASLKLARILEKVLPLKISVNVPSIKNEAMEISQLAEKAGLTVEAIVPATINPEFFPPCIKEIMKGVHKGARNFAISVTLPAFISHARLLPPPDKKDAKISDFISPEVLADELMPIIEEAARNCDPPFFDEQPEERHNVLKSLGVDKNGQPIPNAKWYTPPNCARIKLELGVCHPTDECKGIKNPLQYYIKKMKSQ